MSSATDSQTPRLTVSGLRGMSARGKPSVATMQLRCLGFFSIADNLRNCNSFLRVPVKRRQALLASNLPRNNRKPSAREGVEARPAAAAVGLARLVGRGFGRSVAMQGWQPSRPRLMPRKTPGDGAGRGLAPFRDCAGLPLASAIVSGLRFGR